MDQAKEKRSITDIYKKQISMTEWFQSINYENTSIFRDEDNNKRDKLELLNQIIALPFDKQVKMMASDIRDKTPLFINFLEEHGEELCALRLIPIDPNLPKLRMRGHKAKDVVVKWFPEQKIDCEKYRAEFIPHPEHDLWGTIVIITEKGIFGEVIADGHHNLTQGFYHENKPHIFKYDFKDWTIDPANNEALKHLKEIISHLHVKDNNLKIKLSKEVGCEFTNNYIKGYFETVTSEHGIWFVDYNKFLGESYKDFEIIKGKSGMIKGCVGNKGIASGIARIIKNPETDEFEEGEVLVCDMTSPNYVTLMKKASAIITDRGGVLCHAAIIARELKKPCIVGTGNATSEIKNGDKLIVNANIGVVEKR